MKSVLFGTSMVAATVIAASAAAVQDDGFWPTPEEATRNAAPPPEECLDAAGANICIVAFVAWSGPRWQLVWSAPDTATNCVDRATADFEVDCDAPDAVRQLVLTVCVHSPDGHSGGCGPMRELPYRPTPTP